MSKQAPSDNTPPYGKDDLLKELQQQYEQRIKALEEELYLVKEQMMAQREMLKDAIDYGHHLKAELDAHKKR